MPLPGDILWTLGSLCASAETHRKLVDGFDVRICRVRMMGVQNKEQDVSCSTAICYAPRSRLNSFPAIVQLH